MFVIYAFSNKPMKYYMKFPQAEGFFGEEKIPHGLFFSAGYVRFAWTKTTSPSLSQHGTAKLRVDPLVLGLCTLSALSRALLDRLCHLSGIYRRLLQASIKDARRSGAAPANEKPRQWSCLLKPSFEAHTAEVLRSSEMT